MWRVFALIGMAALLSGAASGQSAESRPAFEIADVHASPRSTNQALRSSVHNGRYELTNATMLDLIRTAYTMDADKVVGGTSWLEYDRFDVVGKVTPNTPHDKLKEMLQSLLADRFKLTVHKDTQPVAGYVLATGKGKPKLKEAEGGSETGCKNSTALNPATQPVPQQINVPMRMLSCHNMTMESFASSLRGLVGNGASNNVVDSTGLKGAWDFDLRWSLAQVPGADTTSIFDAIDKQLGLKLEEQKLPMPVLVVDQVNQKPTANPPDVAAKLPPLPPAEFEVADLKPILPGALPTGPISLGVTAGGRVNLPGVIFGLKSLIQTAWNLNSNQDIAGAPKWIDSARYDVIAKVPTEYVPSPVTFTPMSDLAPMLQALLIDRFKMKVHFEDRTVDAYTLVAVKPKLKKAADPKARTGCKAGNAGVLVLATAIVANRQFTCQNMTMAQFADQLQIFGGVYVSYPVVDATALEGAWDFTLSFAAIPPSRLAGLRGANSFGGAPDAPGASEPVGGTTLFDAIEKQLGLKLEMQKRPYPVFVIDHIDEKPTDN